MKVLLRETVEKLGTIGQIVNVPDGYGRNYLLPKGIALTVTPDNIRRLEAKKQELIAAEAAKRADAEGLAARVKAQTITVVAKAQSEEGKLYGSVTAIAIADAVKALGIPVEPRMILLDQPIKELGAYDVRIRLFPMVEVEAKVMISDPTLAAGKKEEVVAAQSSAEKRAAASEKAARAAARKESAGEAEEAAPAEAAPKKERKAKKEEPVAVEAAAASGDAEAPKKGKKAK
jgi:large subunit ribosomal protein L9